MPGKSLEQRMADTETRIRQLEAQKRLLAQQVKTQQRKDRTRQLIQIGGIMARLGIDTVEKAQALQRVVQTHTEIQAWFGKVAHLVTPERQDAVASSDIE
jgi:alanine racemase